MTARYRLPKILPALLLSAALLLAPGATPRAEQPAASPEIALGQRLFADVRLSNPGTNVQASCAKCHRPSPAGVPTRGFADDIPRSVLSTAHNDRDVLTLRNTPTLVDAGRQERFNHDGQFESLEALIEAKLTGRDMGWNGNAPSARDEIENLLINDAGEGPGATVSYKSEYESVFGVDLEELEKDATIAWTVRAIANYVRSLRSSQTSPWDAFCKINRVSSGPGKTETPDLFAGRILNRMANQSARQNLKRPEAFSAAALEGFKIFFTTYGESSVGNCVVCHVPPTFSDGKFHNTGIAQREYDAIHGQGRFAGLVAPLAKPNLRDTARFRSIPTTDDPKLADLGHWNFADATNPEVRNAGESESEFVFRQVGAFKTPMLRNLAHTAPYMHNGAYADLTAAVSEIVRISNEAKEGKIANIDPEYLKMKLTEADVAPLVAFLHSIEDQSRENFRPMLITVTNGDYSLFLD